MWSIAATRPTVIKRPVPIAVLRDEHDVMKVVVDRARCLGSGMCEAVAPDVFEVDDDGVVRLLAENVEPGQVAAVMAAVGRCPNQALSLSGSEG